MTEISGSSEAAERDQADTVAFLACSATHDGQPVETLETHISRLFLTPDRVFKLKRAIQLPFLDYSTVALREKACRAEYAINRRVAPTLYVGVRPISRTPAGLAFGTGGEIVDWVVEMRRFAERDQFDLLVADGRLTDELVDALADTVAAAHAGADRVIKRNGSARFASIEHNLLDATQPLLTSRIDLADLAAWRRQMDGMLERYAPLLDARGRHGFVRACHGDLHLANICLWEGRPVPFDAIEFDPDMTEIDILYDLAFLLMDLEHAGAGAAANRLLNRYLSVTRDYRGAGLLPMFKSCRAVVRALVAAMKDRPATTYLDLARAYGDRAGTPRLIAVGGRSGTGKSTVAAALAAPIQAVVISSDMIRKRLFGVLPEQPLPPSVYAGDVSQHVYRRLRTDARRALAGGSTVIADATFLESAERDAIAQLAKDCGAAFTGLWLEAPTDIRAERVTARGPNPSDATVAVVQAQARADTGPVGWTPIDAGQDRASLVHTARDRAGIG
ncbi:AAA family ATPase [Parasphingopyxis algicola]|uniref:bifunctional aminoglycoside phosphotransferase/ATP-binding protein n=1 Tax=Parasphingopyxis algicola TaxID=2026624 RepID=UPI0015A435BD|nr:bifunctional aminoglycoside phosphotransferase/ATP-binding protein [Parasphingopyxis algicola]QLC25353.1 AAA family ATPase [Parasphingopyxis algicola]